MNNKYLIRFSFQICIISFLYALFLFFRPISAVSFSLGFFNLGIISFVFIFSGFILFWKLPDNKPIAERFLIMTVIQMLSILSVELAYIFTKQAIELILHGLIFSLVQFLFQTYFLVKIQKN
jgi:hypothetical protein